MNSFWDVFKGALIAVGSGAVAGVAQHTVQQSQADTEGKLDYLDSKRLAPVAVSGAAVGLFNFFISLAEKK
jgi:hypothetical protein